MMNLREKFKTYLDENIKKKDNIAVSTIRLIIAATKDRDIEYRAKNKENEISDSDILNLLQNMIKQRRESVKIYKEAARSELVDRESKEIEVIEFFLPKQISKTELKRIIDDICSEIQADTIKDLGKIIKILKERFPGQLDFKIAADLAKSSLTK